MKKALIILLCLLFYTFLAIKGWHSTIRWKSYMPLFFSVVFYVKFVLIMFLLLERFFVVEQQRKRWTTFLFGAITSTLVGGILWIDTSYLDEYLRPRFINSWNQENMTPFDLMTVGMISGLIGTLSTVIGICSALTSHWLIQKFDANKSKND